jgi:putative membrane protein
MHRAWVLISAVTALVAATAPAEAQRPGGQPPLPASAYGVPWQQINNEDRRFIQEALLASYFAIDLGRLAEQNGGTPAVRRAGTDLVGDNSATAAALGALAGRKGVKPPRGLDPGHIARLDRMAGLRGAAFDSAYLAAAARNRDDEIRACDRAIANGGDPDLRVFARRRRAELTSGDRTARAARAPAAARRP